jgi:hypothetical protein
MNLGDIVDIYDVSNFQKYNQMINIIIDIPNNIIRCDGITIKLNKKDVKDVDVHYNTKYYDLKNIFESHGLLKKKEYAFLYNHYIAIYFRLHTKREVKINECRKYINDKMLCVNRLFESTGITVTNNNNNCDNDYIQLQIIKANPNLDHVFIRGRVYTFSDINKDITIFDSDDNRYTLILELDVYNELNAVNAYKKEKEKEFESFSKGKTLIIPAYYLFKKEYSNEEQEGEIEISIITKKVDFKYSVYIKNFILPNNMVIPVEKRDNKYIKYYSKIFDISQESKYELICFNDYCIIKEELEKEQIVEVTLNFDDFESIFYNYNKNDLFISGYAK